MKEYINKKVLIAIITNSIELAYTATILNVTDTHISFIDKFGEHFTYRVADVKNIREVSQ